MSQNVLQRIISRLPGENLRKRFFLVFAFYKFGHRKLDISNTITARSFKPIQLIEDNKSITW